MKKIENIYDNKDFYQEYMQIRNNKVNANVLLEIPTIKKLLPDLTGKTVLDIGCGYGEMSKYFIKKGAKNVVAIDISKNMIALAKQVNGHKNIEYKIMGMEHLASLNQKFDVVFSSLAFHYVKDFDKLIYDITNLLNKDGELIWSQEHPVGTAAIVEGKSNFMLNGKKYWYFSDYNNETKRRLQWSKVGGTKYHRTFKTILNTLIKHNLTLVKIDESNVIPSAIKKEPKYIYQKDKPYFLFVKAKKN